MDTTDLGFCVTAASSSPVGAQARAMASQLLSVEERTQSAKEKAAQMAEAAAQERDELEAKLQQAEEVSARRAPFATSAQWPAPPATTTFASSRTVPGARST